MNVNRVTMNKVKQITLRVYMEMMNSSAMSAVASK